MKNKIKYKKNIFTITAILAVFLSFLTTNLFVETFASPEESEQEYNSAVNDYIGDLENPEDILEKIMNDNETNKNPDRDSIQYVISRLFTPGAYLNDVRDGVLDTDLGVSESEVRYDGIHACNPFEANNLLNHNCNIPNFTTSLFQNVISPWVSPFSNAGKTSAKAGFRLGVPNGIPGGLVPVNPGQREQAYTALELYGYDLKLTSYNGEWDQITVSTQARMLSNFGLIDHTKLLGTALWESTQSGIAGFIDGFNFTSDRFGRPLSGLFNGFAGGGLNVIIDTKDLNVVATRAWKREKLNNTLYNVYVLSDKEVITETAKQYYREFIATMKGNAELDPKLNLVIDLMPKNIPTFIFIEDWETEESIAAREAAEAYNKAQDDRAATSRANIRDYDTNINYGMGYLIPIEYIPVYVEIPEPVYYTESEQLGFWAEDPNNKPFLELGKEQGLFPQTLEELITFDQVVSNWSSKWETYSNREFAASGDVVQELLKKSDKDLYVNNPHMDSRQAISHYVCSNQDGTPMRDSNGNLEYLYTANNEGSKENVNPRCEPVRSPIGGGLFGDGWHVEKGVDTRHVNEISKDGTAESFYKVVSGTFQSIFRSINSFIAKVTNVILGLSFSPILSELGIDLIVMKLVEGFRDTIFFPMSALAAALGGLLLFFQLFKQGSSAWQLVSSVFITFLIFILGAMFLLRPNITLKLADEWPSAVDNFIAGAVLSDDDGSTYCSTGTEANAIRSAQCNVWGIMVFNPWVHLQFGTGYDNLYANGFAPTGSNGMQNNAENVELVGDAEVNLGDGITVNNWALYQLSKTKVGTITTSDFSYNMSLQTVDKDMYRLVDLQAGPNNGEGTDSRFFKSWSGEIDGNEGILIALLTTIQTIATSLAIIGLGFTKIETSFMFAMSLIILPIMLLYALIPQGKMKLKNYLSSLVSLFIKRISITFLLGIFLKIMSGLSSSSDSLIQSSFMLLVVSIAFIIYKKEIVNLIGQSEQGGFGEQVKEAVVNSVPQDLKNRYTMLKADTKGIAAGAIGGFAGAKAYKRNVNNNLKETQNELVKLKDRSKSETLSKLEISRVVTLEIREKEIKNIIEANESSSTTGAISGAISGAKSAKSIIGRRTERQIRKSGFSQLEIVNQVRDEVVEKGRKDILDNELPIESDVYKDIISEGDTSQMTKTTSDKLDRENASLLLNKDVQKLVRKEAEKRRKLATDETKKNAVSTEEFDLSKLREIVETRRKANRIVNKVLNPKEEKQRLSETNNKKDSSNITSSSKDIKEQILKKQAEDEARRKQKEELEKDKINNKEKSDEE